MIIDENTMITYIIYDHKHCYIQEFTTREAANKFIDCCTKEGKDTLLWSVIPEVHYNGD